MTTLLKSYDISARIPMTTEARNAGATGSKFWWAHVATVSAASKQAACAKARSQAPAHADRLKAYAR